MTSIPLPPVASDVLVAAVDGLPARLRGKLDAATARVAGWDVSVVDGGYAIAVDATTTVTLQTENGVVRSVDAATCTCLLAPNCLHRAAVLAHAPVDAGQLEPVDPGDEAVLTVDVPSADVANEDVLTPAQVSAVDSLWRAVVAVIEAGVTGSGIVARTALLRAAHDAQAHGVHRGATAARAVATLLQAARANEPQYRLADLADAVRDLLDPLHQLRHPGHGADMSNLLGTARRRYDLHGSLRLYGLCTTAVITDSGYAGVLTYVLDRDGLVWTIADIAPGDASRAANAGNSTVALGESALTHRALTRAGLVVSGATASVNRQLGAGRSVQAVTAAGAGWHDEPFAALWAQPLDAQVNRAFEALAQPVTDRPAGGDLLFLSVRVAGSSGDAVRVVCADGTALTLRIASDHGSLAYRENLGLLGRSPGLDLWLIGRPDPGRHATVYPLAVAPADAAGVGWKLPPAMHGHIDLAYDRLHRGHLPPAADTPSDGVAEAPVPRNESTDPALDLLRRTLDRAVAGGRSVLAISPSSRHLSDARQMLRARLDTGSALLDQLTTSAAARPRDAFGRLAGDDSTGYATAWLAAAVYADAAHRAFAEASWLATSSSSAITP